MKANYYTSEHFSLLEIQLTYTNCRVFIPTLQKVYLHKYILPKRHYPLHLGQILGEAEVPIHSFFLESELFCPETFKQESICKYKPADKVTSLTTKEF